MKTRIIAAAVIIIAIAAVLKCRKVGGSEEDFALDLAKKTAELVNNGPVEVPGLGGERVFADPDFEIKLIQKAGFGTYEGRVELKDYESAIGEVSGELHWELDYINPPGSNPFERVVWDQVVHTFSGKIVDEDENVVDVNYSFITKRGDGFPEKPYDESSVELSGGFVQVGEKEAVQFGKKN